MVLITFLILFVHYSNVSSRLFKTQINETKNHNIEIVFDSNTQQQLTGNYIGSNSNYLFILNQSKSLEIIPIHSKIERILRK